MMRAILISLLIYKEHTEITHSNSPDV